MPDPTFQLTDKVVVGNSDVKGTVVAVTLYSVEYGFPTSYLISYTNRQTGIPEEGWFRGNQLNAAPAESTSGL